MMLDVAAVVGLLKWQFVQCWAVLSTIPPDAGLAAAVKKAKLGMGAGTVGGVSYDSGIMWS